MVSNSNPSLKHLSSYLKIKYINNIVLKFNLTYNNPALLGLGNWHEPGLNHRLKQKKILIDTKLFVLN